MAISFDAANRARDLLVQVRSTLDEVGDADIGWIKARWTDGARRAKLGEASRQVGEAIDELQAYDMYHSPHEKIGMASLVRLRASIDEIQTGDRRVAKVVGRQMQPAWGDPMNRKARALDAKLLHAEVAALEMPATTELAKLPELDYQHAVADWDAHRDALVQTVENVLRRSDDELTRADFAVLDRTGMRSIHRPRSQAMEYPSEPLHGVLQVRSSPDPIAEVADVRRWIGQDVPIEISGNVFTIRRARNVLDAARSVIGDLPENLPAPIATLRDQTRELVERNADRIEGRRWDTFGRSPDYAEVGRIRENLALLSLGGTKAAAPERVAW